MTVQLCASHMRNLVFCCVKQLRFEFCMDTQKLKTDQNVEISFAMNRWIQYAMSKF